MIGCLRTHVRKQPIIVLYFESETVLKFYNLEAWWANSSCQGRHLLSVDQKAISLQAFLFLEEIRQIHDGYISVETAFGKKTIDSLVTLCFGHQIIKND